MRNVLCFKSSLFNVYTFGHSHFMNFRVLYAGVFGKKFRKPWHKISQNHRHKCY